MHAGHNTVENILNLKIMHGLLSIINLYLPQQGCQVADLASSHTYLLIHLLVFKIFKGKGSNSHRPNVIQQPL